MTPASSYACASLPLRRALALILATVALMSVHQAALADAASEHAMGTPIGSIYGQYTPAELHAGGYSFGDIIGASPGTDYADIKTAGATVMDFRAASKPVAAVYSLYTLSQLRAGGYSFGEIIDASPGTDYADIKTAGATVMDFRSASKPVAAVYSLYTPTQLHDGGYSFGQIIGAAPGTDYADIKTAGATAVDFHDAGKSAADVNGVFSSLELVGGGFTDVTNIDWSLLGNTDIHSPASVFEQVTAAGNVSFAPNTILEIAFNGTGSSVDWDDAFWSSNHAWTILDVAGTTTGFDNLSLAQADWLDSFGHSFSSAHPSGSFSLALDPLNGNSVRVLYAVPEPATYVHLMLGGAAALWGWRHRGRRRLQT